jgi:putative endonuclease
MAESDRASRAERGRRAEAVVAAWAEAQGFVVLGRNVRVGRLEIDLLARDGDVVAVIEVRTRGPGAWQRGLDSIDAAKRARLRQAGAALWRTRFAAEAWAERMRFDAASVSFDADDAPTVEYVKAAL